MQHARGTYLFCAGGLAVSWAWYSTNVSFSASLISEAYESLRGRGHFFALFCNPNRRIRFFMVNHTKGKAPTTGFFPSWYLTSGFHVWAILGVFLTRRDPLWPITIAPMVSRRAGALMRLKGVLVQLLAPSYKLEKR